MTASPAQNAASLGRFAAKFTADSSELRNLRERLRLASRDDEYIFGGLMAALNTCVFLCRLLEKRIKGEGET